MERVINEDSDSKIYQNLVQSDPNSLKILLSNLFDRSEAFKKQMKQLIFETYLEIIGIFVRQETINYLTVIRQ